MFPPDYSEIDGKFRIRSFEGKVAFVKNVYKCGMTEDFPSQYINCEQHLQNLESVGHKIKGEINRIKKKNKN